MEERRRPARVLVVDGEPGVLRALELALREKGHEVVALDSPVAAARRLAAEDFDVAILDARAQEPSGIELLDAVRRRRPEIEVVEPDEVEHVACAVARAAERRRLQARNRELETRLAALEAARGLVGNGGPVREAAGPAADADWLARGYAAAKDAALRSFERCYVEALMRACDDNISAAARRAGMDRSNFKRVLRKCRSDAAGEGAPGPSA